MSRIDNNKCRSESFPTELMQPLPQSKMPGTTDKKSSGRKDPEQGEHKTAHKTQIGSDRISLLDRESRGGEHKGAVARLRNKITGDRLSLLSGRLRTRGGGREIEGTVLEGSTNPKRVLRAKWKLGTAYAGITDDKKGLSMGISVNAAQGSLVAGKPFSAARKDDEKVRLGLALGLGAAIRVHNSDDDGDGKREKGIGIDVGPFSFDIKSENWAHTLIPALRYHRK